MDTITLEQLLAEQVVWYKNYVVDHGRVPKSLSGVSSDGKRFIVMLDLLVEMKLDHVQRHKFIKAILEQEKAESYVYGTLMMAYPDQPAKPEERLDIIAAHSRRFVWGSWCLIRGRDGRAKEIQHLSTHEGHDPEQYPGAWFLTSSLNLSGIERRKFNNLWSQLRANGQFSSFAPIAISSFINAQGSDWIVVHEFGSSKTYVDRVSITRKDSSIQALVKYVLVPMGTDKRNGRLVKEMLMLEEYETITNRFRIHQIVLTYDDGTKSDTVSGGDTWNPATGGNGETLEFLRSTPMAQ